MKVRRRWLAGFVTLGAVAALYACSGTESGGNSFGSGTGTGGSGGVAGGGADDASVQDDGSSESGGESGIFVETGLGDGQITADSACAAEEMEAQRIPLDLYIMADRSGSMDNADSPTRWEDQSNALISFFDDPQSEGLFVALRFFPLDDGLYPQDSACSGNAYATPLVDWGELPAHAGELTAAVNMTSPDGLFTPTQEAINGVLMGARQRQLAEPQHIVAAVIVSDGEPCCGDCVEDPSQLGQIASQYANGTPPIKTFAIYVADEASEVMARFAHDGGTGSAYDATGGQQAFIDALNDIRGSMLACEYKMPETDGGTINPELVQVEYTPGGVGDPEKIDHVTDAAACVGGQGWYYDNNDTPSKLIMCEGTCETLQNDEKAHINILVGCSDIQH